MFENLKGHLNISRSESLKREVFRQAGIHHELLTQGDMEAADEVAQEVYDAVKRLEDLDPDNLAAQLFAEPSISQIVEPKR